jgi:hypothetical protein
VISVHRRLVSCAYGYILANRRALICSRRVTRLRDRGE